MSSVVNVYPTQKDIVKKLFSPPDETTDVMRDWGHGSWVMRPRRCFKRRLRYCPYDVISAWRSFRKLRSLFNDFPLLIVPSWDETSSFMKTSQNRVKINVEESNEENTCAGEKDNQEAAPGVYKETNKEEQPVNITINKDCNKDGQSEDKKWQYKEAAGNCDEPRAFTEDRWSLVEGCEHDSDSSVMVRHVTTPRPRPEPDAMPESHNREKLVRRHEWDEPPIPSITTVNSDKLETTGDKNVTNDRPEEESKVPQAKAMTKEEQNTKECGE